MEVALSQYRSNSVQEFQFAFGEKIRRPVFYANLVQHIETHIKLVAVIKTL